MSGAVRASMVFTGVRGAGHGIYASMLITQLRLTHFDVAQLGPTHFAAAYRSSTSIV
jgi:hypothetical protein